MELFKSLENKTKSFSDPFDHFEINQPLTEKAIKEISEANVPDHIIMGICGIRDSKTLKTYKKFNPDVLENYVDTIF